MPSLPPPDAARDDRLQLLVECYYHLIGKKLVACKSQDIDVMRQALWDAPRGIVAHGTESDPI